MQVIIILVLVRIMGWLLALIKQSPISKDFMEDMIAFLLGHWPFSIGKYFLLDNTHISNIIMELFYIGRRYWSDSLHVHIIPYAAGASFAIYLYDINNRVNFTPPDRPAFILLAASNMSFTAFLVLYSCQNQWEH